MEKKSYLAVALSLLILVAWQKFYLEPIQQQSQQYQRQQQEARERAATRKAPEAAPVPQEQRTSPVGASEPGKGASSQEVKERLVENPASALVLTNDSFAVKGWSLKAIPVALDKRDQNVDLEAVTGFNGQIRVRTSDAAINREIPAVWAAVEPAGPREYVARTLSSLVEITRKFTLDETGFGARLQLQFRFFNTPPKTVFVDLIGSPKRAADQEGSIFGQAPDKVHLSLRDFKGRHSHMGAQLTESIESPAGVRWLGVDTRYFVAAMVPKQPEGDDFGAQLSAVDQSGASAVRASIAIPVSDRKELSVISRVYFGPKDMDSLVSVDPILADAIDFGWTSFIAVPLLRALKWLHGFLGNWGLAIIVLTFLIKMLLFPLMYKSMTSMAKMSKLQPQLNALREKYKDDKEKLNVEMMNFMRANGYNPVGGCLPILLQMPIFFALYRVLFNSMELYQAPFAGWIRDLSSPDPFFITPLLLTGLMYLQQKISPTTAADPAQQKMLQWMPVMFGAFMLMLPSGLTIYMVVNSAVSILQQYFLNRKLGIGSPSAAGASVSARA